MMEHWECPICTTVCDKLQKYNAIDMAVKLYVQPGWEKYMFSTRLENIPVLIL